MLENESMLIAVIFMKNRQVFLGALALSVIGSAIVGYQKSADARYFTNNTVPCYFFKGETLKIKEICQSDGASWIGGGGHSLKWSDGETTQIKFGLHGRGTPVCLDKEQISVDGKCGANYRRSTKNFRRITNYRDDSMNCVQLTGKSVCWGMFKE